MMEFHGKYNYTDRRILRKKHKNSRQNYKIAKRNLKYSTGHYYFEPLWLYIRHNEAINGSAPVFQRFLIFGVTISQFNKKMLCTHMTLVLIIEKS